VLGRGVSAPIWGQVPPGPPNPFRQKKPFQLVISLCVRTKKSDDEARTRADIVVEDEDIRAILDHIFQ
jgi:hypothetical protein